MTTGRNKTPLVGWHPSAGLVAWLEAEVERRGGGRGVRSAILEDALAAHMRATETARAAEPVRIGGIEIPVTVDDRQPPGIVSVIAPGEKKTEVRSFTLAPEEPAPAPEPFRTRAAKLPCEHRVQPGAYCARCGKLI